METVLHRAGLSSRLHYVVPELSQVCLIIDQPPRGRVSCQSALPREAESFSSASNAAPEIWEPVWIIGFA